MKHYKNLVSVTAILFCVPLGLAAVTSLAAAMMGDFTLGLVTALLAVVVFGIIALLALLGRRH